MKKDIQVIKTRSVQIKENDHYKRMSPELNLMMTPCRGNE